MDWGSYARYNTYLSVKVDRDDNRPWHVQGMLEISPQSLDQLVLMEFSSEHYDRNRTSTDTPYLTCRRVLISSFSNSMERLRKQPKKIGMEYVLQLLSQASIQTLKKPITIQNIKHISSHRNKTYSQHPEPVYQYVSLFSGCGGDCRGARDAGARISFALDKHEPANKTNRLNHPKVPIYCDDVSNIAMYDQRECRICHMSVCCQPHSMAHTRPGKNDDANYLTSLCCREVIESLTPDIVTLENVRGLTTKQASSQWYVAIINQLAETGPGYNVRWGLVNFREHGLAARRTRLVAFASR